MTPSPDEMLGEANDLALEIRRERDEARRELEELRSAAREHLDAHDAVQEVQPDATFSLARSRAAGAAIRLAALLGVEDTTEPTEETT